MIKIRKLLTLAFLKRNNRYFFRLNYNRCNKILEHAFIKNVEIEF